MGLEAAHNADAEELELKRFAKDVERDTDQYIKTALSELDIRLNPGSVREILKIVTSWEMMPTHVHALNTPLLGVYPMAFTQQHRQELFHAVNTDQGIIDGILKRLPSVNQDHKVASDPFYILCIWLIYLSTIVLKGDYLQECRFQIAKYMRYCVFSGALRASFPQCAPNEAVMQAAIEGLSAKFDIRTKGTWKLVIDGMAREFISPGSIHNRTLTTMYPDKGVFYAITDTATRMRGRVFAVAERYYDAYQKGDLIRTVSASVETEDGNTTARIKTVPIDGMITNVVPEVLNHGRWVDNKWIQFLCKRFSAVSEHLLTTVLLDIHQQAVAEQRNGAFRSVTVKDGVTVPVGIGAILEFTIRNMYRYAMNTVIKDGDDSNPAVYTAILNIYQASQVRDQYIVTSKQAISQLVDQFERVKREATKSSLRLAVIMYIFLKTIQYR